MTALLDVRHEHDRVILLLDGNDVSATLAAALGTWARSRPQGRAELFIRTRLRIGRPADLRVTRARFEPPEPVVMLDELRALVAEHEVA